MSLFRQGLLKGSKSFKNKGADNEKSVDFNPKVSTLNIKGEEKIEIKPEQSKKSFLGISETFSPIRDHSNNKFKCSSQRTLNPENKNSLIEDENDEFDDFENENIFVYQKYYEKLRKSPYENWALNLKKLNIFSFFLGHLSFHKNKFSNYCSICSLKKPLKKNTIICEDCLNAIILFELILRKKLKFKFLYVADRCFITHFFLLPSIHTSLPSSSTSLTGFPAQ